MRSAAFSRRRWKCNVSTIRKLFFTGKLLGVEAKPQGALLAGYWPPHGPEAAAGAAGLDQCLEQMLYSSS